MNSLPTELKSELLTLMDQGLNRALGIELVQAEPGRIVAQMPVDEAVMQPFGSAHGGSLSALAETVASIGGILLVNYPTQGVVGQQVSINLVRPALPGQIVEAIGICEHHGRTSQVWNVTMRATSAPEKLIASARILLAVVER